MAGCRRLAGRLDAGFRFEPLRFAGGERGRHGFVDGVIANHFQQRPAFGGRRAKIEQPAGGLVGQHDPLPRVDGDHAFDHAAQHGRLPIARLAELRHAAAQAPGSCD